MTPLKKKLYIWRSPQQLNGILWNLAIASYYVLEVLFIKGVLKLPQKIKMMEENIYDSKRVDKNGLQR